jgi:hypothetical protein
MLNSFYLRLPGTHHEYVDSVFSMLQYVYPLLTVTLGYLPPPSDGGLGGGPEYDIYLSELGNLYGETVPDYGIPTGDTVSTFIRMDNDYQFVTPSRNKGMPGLRVSVAHELFHSIQLGRYGYWWASDTYFYEVSSTWVEDVAYTDVNDYYGYLHAPWSHFRYPETAFASGSNVIMYSRGIWGQYVQKRHGVDAMRRTWEFIRQGRPALAIDNALRELGSSFPEGFAEWVLWNHFTGERSDPVRYYPEGANFPIIAQTPVDFSPPTRQLNGSLSPLSARYYQVMYGQDTLTLAVANTNLASSFGSGSSFAYTLTISDAQTDPSYQPTGTGLYVKLDVADPVNWETWIIVGNMVNDGPRVMAGEGTPFPNPFRAGGPSSLFIPVASESPQEGTLYIYSAAMDLVFDAGMMSHSVRGRQAFEWTGRTNTGELAESGVYVFVVNLQNRVVTGKVALIRE